MANSSPVTNEFKTEVVTPPCRLSYPSIFKPKHNKLSGKMEFSFEGLFDVGTDLTAMKKAAEAALIKKFGEDKAKWPKNIKSPFRDQSEKMKDGKLPEGCVSGGTFVRFKSEKRPGVVDQNRVEILDDSTVYAGCYVRAHVNAFAYDQAGNKGVSFGLNHVQLVKDGEPFSGRPKVEDAFSPVEGFNSGADASSIF